MVRVLNKGWFCEVVRRDKKGDPIMSFCNQTLRVNRRHALFMGGLGALSLASMSSILPAAISDRRRNLILSVDEQIYLSNWQDLRLRNHRCSLQRQRFVWSYQLRNLIRASGLDLSQGRCPNNVKWPWPDHQTLDARLSEAQRILKERQANVAGPSPGLPILMPAEMDFLVRWYQEVVETRLFLRHEAPIYYSRKARQIAREYLGGYADNIVVEFGPNAFAQLGLGPWEVAGGPTPQGQPIWPWATVATFHARVTQGKPQRGN